MATRVKKQARQSAQKAYYMELLMNCNQKLQQGTGRMGDHPGCRQSRSQSLLDRPVLYALAVPDQEPEFRVTPAEEAGRCSPP